MTTGVSLSSVLIPDNTRAMRLQGLQFVEQVNVPRTYIKDILGECTTHAIGGGEWSIEAHHKDGRLLKEFVGANGTQSYVGEDGYLHNEEVADLWSELHDWAEKTIWTEAHSYKKYQAPDGTKGSYTFFTKEVMKGHLHGLIAIF